MTCRRRRRGPSAGPASGRRAASQSAPCGARRAPLEVRERRVVRRDQPGSGAPLDRHVADGHPPLHRERADARRRCTRRHGRCPRPRRAGRSRRGSASFGVSPGWSEPTNSSEHRARPGLRQRLGREDVLDLRRADREGERAQGAVRGRVRVAADDRQPGLREAQLGPDHVDDPLAARIRSRGARSRTPRSSARSASSWSLAIGSVTGPSVVGTLWSIVATVSSGSSHTAPGQSQSLERLGRGHLVDEVEVDVEQRRLARHLDGRRAAPRPSRTGWSPSSASVSSDGVYTPGTPAPRSPSPERRRTR